MALHAYAHVSLTAAALHLEVQRVLSSQHGQTALIVMPTLGTAPSVSKWIWKANAMQHASEDKSFRAALGLLRSSWMAGSLGSNSPSSLSLGGA